MTAVFFEFESDFVATLRCVPMVGRYKLDACGVKLFLRAWNRVQIEVRSRMASILVELPVDASPPWQEV